MKKYYDLVKTKLLGQGFTARYIHTLGVVNEAKELASIYNENIEDAELAALFHDFFRHDSLEVQSKYLTETEILNYQKQPIVYHAISASHYVEETIKPKNHDIVLAIRNHIWGRPNMTTLEKILIIADKSEVNRKFEIAKTIRKVARINLDQALLMTLKNSIEHVILTNQSLNEEQILTYNYYNKEEKIIE